MLVLNIYYAVIAGNSSFPLETFDATGVSLYQTNTGFDCRGLWWNPNLNQLETNGQNIIENSEKLLYDLAEKGSFSSSLIKFDDAMKQTIEMASAAYKNEEGIVGVPTGLRDLDDRLGGLHQSDLIIIAGRPSMGKTSLATNIAFNAAQKIQENGSKSSVAFFSLEMSSEQLSTRIISEQARIGSNDIRRGRISDEQFDQFLETSKNISELPLFIDETPAISIAAMSNRARRIKRIHGLDLIVVDYIQLMRGNINNTFASSASTPECVTDDKSKLQIDTNAISVALFISS